MQILLYSGFKKRENSTKTPLVADATRTLTGYLREPCSIMNPVFKIERFPADASPQSFNYAYIPAFSRWYFVRDWAWSEGLWQCQLEVDVLSSFKTDIGNSQAYIERSASAYNGAITDKQYLATTNFNTQRVPISTSWAGQAPSAGCYVVGIICSANRTSSQIGGAVTYYVMSPAQMNALMSYLLGTPFLEDNGFPAIATALQQLTQETAKSLINPVQYIASCMWFPSPPSELGDGTNHQIVIGYYDIDTNHATGQYLRTQITQHHLTGQIPIHPQAPTRGKYLNYSPYTRLTLHVQPFGAIPIDTSFCEIGSYLYGTVWIDTITGKAVLRLELYPDESHTGTGAIVCETSSMMGIPIQISQMSPDFFNAIPAAVTAGMAIYQGMNGDMSAFDIAAPNLGNAIQDVMPQVERQGITGSFLAETVPAQLTAQHFIITDEDNTEFGRPLCAVRTINTLSGFIKCKDAHVDFPCYRDEKTKILSFMQRGFFWE